MKFSEDKLAGKNLISGYGEDYIAINEKPYRHSLILTPEQIISPWEVNSANSLGIEQMAPLQALNIEVVILGTGRSIQFPDPRISASFLSRGIGFEVMDTAAACRTYAILTAENRRVAAAIILP